ncbi:MAG: hypothetical protein JWO68_1614 [Actinomycetia bacterium]|nr:hypothetical protein [Actinomycetes bacterium]
MTDDGVHPGEMPDELDAFLDDLRHAAADAPAPAVGEALATLFREGTAPVVVVPARRRWAVRAVVAGAVAGVAFGGLGVAGALPRPVQRRVADVVDHVGVHLPDARPATTTSTTVTVPLTTTPPTTATPAPRPVTTTTTVDDHGGGPGQDGGNDSGGTDDGKSGKGSGKGSDKGTGTSTSGGTDDHVDSSGRNPDGGADVHIDEGSDHSGHDEGRSG